MTNYEHQLTHEARRALTEPRVLLLRHDGSECWVDACAEPEVLQAELADGRILDSDGFGTFVVYLDEAAEVLASVARGIREHGEAFAAWAQFHDADPTILAAFPDHYLAHFRSLAEFGTNLVGAAGVDIATLVPEPLVPYVHIDYEAVAENELRGTKVISLPDGRGGIYVFWGPDGGAVKPTAPDSGNPAVGKGS